MASHHSPGDNRQSTEGGPKEHRAKQKWPHETHSVTYVLGCTRALHSFRPFAYCYCCTASTVIPLSPKATFTPSIQPNLGLPRTHPPLTSAVPTLHLLPPSTSFWPYGAHRVCTHPFFPHVQTISILSDLLYALTPFLFQLSFAPLHS